MDKSAGRPHVAEGKFDFGFAVDWMRKDLGLVLDEARTATSARLEVTALVDQFYAEVQSMKAASAGTPPASPRAWNATIRA